MNVATRRRTDSGKRPKSARAPVGVAAIARATLDDPRWAAVVARDKAADGQFYYSVKTTGVYCRPSCGARLARPENVGFHQTPADAERAGFRSCKRCKPAEPSRESQYTAMVTRAVRSLETAEEAPRLKVLAAEAGISPYHFHRIFKSRTGLTPRQYAIAVRAGKMRRELDREQSVTDAIFEAGYGSSSRFYEQSNARLGMTPANYRAGGAGTEIRFAVGQSSLGAILVARSELGVCAILLGDDPEELVRELQDRFSEAELIGGDADFEQLIARLVGQIESPGRIADLDLPLDVRGTAFQQRVWQALQQIPTGTTVSYTELARQIGMPKAARAVARACAANSLALVIPCHRVIKSDGGLSGYRWGIERKRILLEREQASKSEDRP